jgi:hypothetical protein
MGSGYPKVALRIAGRTGSAASTAILQGTSTDTDILAHGKIGAVALDPWVPQVELIQAQGIRVHVDNGHAGIRLVHGIMSQAWL